MRELIGHLVRLDLDGFGEREVCLTYPDGEGDEVDLNLIEIVGVTQYTSQSGDKVVGLDIQMDGVEV